MLLQSSENLVLSADSQKAAGNNVEDSPEQGQASSNTNDDYSVLVGYDPNNERRQIITIRKRGPNMETKAPSSIYRSRGDYCRNVLQAFEGLRQLWPYAAGLASRLSSQSNSADEVYMIVETNHPILERVVRLGPLNELGKNTDCLVCQLVTFAIKEMLPPQTFTDLGDRSLFLLPVVASTALGLKPYRSADELQSATYLKICIELNKFKISDPGLNLELTDISLSLSRGEGGFVFDWLARDTEACQQGFVDMARVKDWVETCEEKDRYVCIDTIPLLDDDLRLYLIDVFERKVVRAPKNVRYLALSYVWGRTQHYETNLRYGGTDGVLSVFGYSLTSLPQTIEDAFIVTAELGERYIWIDAYCISHHDLDERANILRNMHKVYRSAILTIFALSNTDASEGLPGVTKRSLLPQASVKLRGGSSLAAFLNNSLQDTFSNSFWSTRGWCFQEGWFSSRCLCFTEEEVFFWCNNRIRFETADDSDRVSGFSFDEDGTRRKPPMHLQLTQNWDFSIYADLISMYRLRDLTFETDVLNAFQGVLSYLSERHTMRFAVGLPYNEDFARALSWEFWGFGLMTERTRLEEFPSWSWAGWTGEVGYRWKNWPLNWGHRHALLVDWDYRDMDTAWSSRSGRDLMSFAGEHFQARNWIERYEELLPKSVSLLRLYTLVARFTLEHTPYSDPIWRIHERNGEEVSLQHLRKHVDREFMHWSTQFDAQSDDWKNNALREGAEFLFLVAFPNSPERYPGPESWVTTMVIDRRDHVAYRVAIVHIPMDVWERANPVQKLVFLG